LTLIISDCIFSQSAIWQFFGHFENSINMFSILTKVVDRRQVSSAKSGSFNCWERPV